MTLSTFSASALRADDSAVCLSLAGDLDLAAVATLQEVLDGVEKLAPADLVLDLSGLTFMDSTGLHCIVRAHDRVKKAGRRLALIPGPDIVQRVVALTGMDKHLEFTTAAARDALLVARPAVA